MKKTILILIASCALAQGNIIPIGQVTFTGDFTLNHLYDFNHQELQPFGWFHDQTVTQSGGIFSPFVEAGQVANGQPLWSIGSQMPLFTVGGFNLITNFLVITGADSGRTVTGQVDMSGNGFEPNPDIAISWQFIAPPYDITNFPEDITGAITLRFFAFFDNHHVPDNGTTLGLLLVGLAGLFLCRGKVAREGLRPYLVNLQAWWYELRHSK